MKKDELIKNLPKFKYHPNLYSLDIVTFEKGVCQCCQKEVDAFITSMYSPEEIECICLECVKSGEAAEKFEGDFIDSFESRINDENKIEELCKKTPGYYSWQGENWLVCCDDFCEFIGYTNTEELNELGITDVVFKDYIEKNDNSDEDYSKKLEYYKDNLKKGGFMSGYLFRCSHCGKYRLDIDYT